MHVLETPVSDQSNPRLGLPEGSGYDPIIIGALLQSLLLSYSGPTLSTFPVVLTDCSFPFMDKSLYFP